MTDKRRKNHNQRFDVVRKLPINEFWNAVKAIYEKRDKEFSLEHVAALTHRNITEIEGELDTATRHHIFITTQYSIKADTAKRRKYPTRNTQDRAGTLMASLREQHENATGENRPLSYWKPIVDEKMLVEKKTNIRNFIMRIDTSFGFELQNLYLRPVKNGKRKYVSDYPAVQEGYDKDA